MISAEVEVQITPEGRDLLGFSPRRGWVPCWEPGQTREPQITAGALVRVLGRQAFVGTVVALDRKRGPIGCAWIVPGLESTTAEIEGLGNIQVWTGCGVEGCRHPSSNYEGACNHATPELADNSHGKSDASKRGEIPFTDEMTAKWLGAIVEHEGELAIVDCLSVPSDRKVVTHFHLTKTGAGDGVSVRPCAVSEPIGYRLGPKAMAAWTEVTEMLRANADPHDPSGPETLVKTCKRLVDRATGLRHEIVHLLGAEAQGGDGDAVGTLRRLIARAHAATVPAIAVAPICGGEVVSVVDAFTPGQVTIEALQKRIRELELESSTRQSIVDDIQSYCARVSREESLDVIAPERPRTYCALVLEGLQKRIAAATRVAEVYAERRAEFEAALAGAAETERQLREEIAEMGSAAWRGAGDSLEFTCRLQRVLTRLTDTLPPSNRPTHDNDWDLVKQFETLAPLLGPSADVRDAPEIGKLETAIIGGHQTVFGHGSVMGEADVKNRPFLLLQRLVDAAHRERRYRKVAEEIGSWFISREDAHRPILQSEALEKLEALLKQRKLMPRLARAEVLAFACAMETGLAKREHGYWLDETPRALLKWLKREIVELERMLPKRGGFATRGADPRLLGETACIAALAMMIADVRGALDVRPVS